MAELKSGYKMFKCTKCGEHFPRYHAHPYIKHCKSCRKGESLTQKQLDKQKSGKDLSGRHWCAPEELQDRYTREGDLG